MNRATRTAANFACLGLAIGIHSSLRAQGEPPGFAAALPASIKWAANPVIPGAVSAVVIGDAGKAGPYVVRVKFPDAYRVAPHTHPDPQVCTVLAGVYHLGLGDRYEESTLKAYPAGSVFSLPANVSHSHLSEGETIIQCSGFGPAKTSFVNPADDPRRK